MISSPQVRVISRTPKLCPWTEPLNTPPIQPCLKIPYWIMPKPWLRSKGPEKKLDKGFKEKGPSVFLVAAAEGPHRRRDKGPHRSSRSELGWRWPRGCLSAAAVALASLGATQKVCIGVQTYRRQNVVTMLTMLMTIC